MIQNGDRIQVIMNAAKPIPTHHVSNIGNYSQWLCLLDTPKLHWVIIIFPNQNVEINKINR